MAIRILSKKRLRSGSTRIRGRQQNSHPAHTSQKRSIRVLGCRRRKKRLQVVLTDYAKEREAFAILLTGYCETSSTPQVYLSEDWMIIPNCSCPMDILEESGVIHLLNTNGCDQRQRLPESRTHRLALSISHLGAER